MPNSTSSLTPYSYLDKKSFWKTGVAQADVGSEVIENIHSLKAMDRNTRICSAGSCFAQNVGNWLINNGFNFKASNLGMDQNSSFGFGNIYTPKSFLQWLTYSEDKSMEHTIFRSDTGRYFDLLRPSVFPKGFGSANSLKESRQAAKEEMNITLSESDVLIFTLGLTEAWKDVNGIYYPTCPGVISGKFDKTKFSFHQFNYCEITSDLEAIKNQILKLNSKLKVILTVSPVPLTATASQNHVLVASQYSKAVLRAVAGYLSNNEKFFSYFPSYEIVTVNKKGDFRFEKNRRTISQEAIDYVMEHFNTAFQCSEQAPSQPVIKVSEAICDEERIESLRKLKIEASKNSEPKKLTLVGDSHMGQLSTAFNSIGVDHAGGMIMNGSGFSDKKFALCPTEYLVPLESPDSRKLWSSALFNIQKHEEYKTTSLSKIITNIGVQTHRTISRFLVYMLSEGKPKPKPDAIRQEDLLGYFKKDQQSLISILIQLRKSGHEVIVISDPPLHSLFDQTKNMAPAVKAYHEALSVLLSDFDIQFLNVLNALQDEGKPIESLALSNDCIHGNKDYYNWLAKKIIEIKREGKD